MKRGATNRGVDRVGAVWSVVIGGLVVVMVAGGCQSSGARDSRPSEPPPGTATARATLPDEALDQFIDLAAQDIARQLPLVPMVQESRYRQVLGLGVLRGVGFPSSAAAEAAIRRLQSRLTTNQQLTDAFRMVDMSHGEADRVLSEIAGGSDTTRSPRTSTAGAHQTYRSQDVLVLSGDFLQAGSPDAGAVTYTFTATVQHPYSRSQVLATEFRRNFRWDASRMRWIAAD